MAQHQGHDEETSKLSPGSAIPARLSDEPVFTDGDLVFVPEGPYSEVLPSL
jgi:hypothetical protein